MSPNWKLLGKNEWGCGEEIERWEGVGTRGRVDRRPLSAPPPRRRQAELAPSGPQGRGLGKSKPQSGPPHSCWQQCRLLGATSGLARPEAPWRSRRLARLVPNAARVTTALAGKLLPLNEPLRSRTSRPTAPCSFFSFFSLQFSRARARAHTHTHTHTRVFVSLQS